MALENYGSGKIFLQIADGKLVRSFKEANASTKQRINKNGKVVHEQHYDAITAVITGVAKRENEYGIFLEIIMHDGDDNYQISTQFSGRYSSAFLKALPNVDINHEVKLLPWAMQDKSDPSKKVTGITLYQSGNKIAPFYTKENPNGLPQMKQVTLKGKTQWDDTDMMQFLFDAAVNVFKPVLVSATVSSDDLPF